MSALDNYKNIIYVKGSSAIGSDDEIFGEKIAEAEIPMGGFIVAGASRDMVKKPSTSSDKLIGFVPPMVHYTRIGHNVDKVSISGMKYLEYKVEAKMNVPYVMEGYKKLLLVDVDVLKGEAIYVNVSTGNLTNISTGNIRLGNSFFEYDVLAGNYHITSFHLL